MQTDVQMDQEEDNYDYGEDELTYKRKNDMLSDPDFEARYQRAKKLVKDMEGFYYHLVVFLFMSLFFYFIDVRYDGILNWAYWVWFGWGLGVMGHYFSTREERKIRELMASDIKPKRWG